MVQVHYWNMLCTHLYCKFISNYLRNKSFLSLCATELSTLQRVVLPSKDCWVSVSVMDIAHGQMAEGGWGDVDGEAVTGGMCEMRWDEKWQFQPEVCHIWLEFLSSAASEQLCYHGGDRNDLEEEGWWGTRLKKDNVYWVEFVLV